jgi:putative ABC transport system ATP-binding protein
MPPKLEARNLSRRIDGEGAIVEDVDFSLDRGRILAVLGPSGAGKTTLLRLLNRLDEPTGGTVLLDGVDYREIDPREVRRRVGYVLQKPAMLDGTVRENMTAGPRIRNEPVDEARLQGVLDRFDIADLPDRDASELSGGEKRRVALARALTNEPEVLLLDEPTADLDGANEARAEALVDQLVDDEGLACVLVTHDPDQARRMGDTALRLENGHVQARGTPAEVVR